MELDLGAATAATFLPHVGSAFALRATEATVALTLTAVAPADGRPFELTFEGPAAPHVPQATWTLEHDVLGTLAVFLVPSGPTTYRATFA